MEKPRPSIASVTYSHNTGRHVAMAKVFRDIAATTFDLQVVEVDGVRRSTAPRGITRELATLQEQSRNKSLMMIVAPGSFANRPAYYNREEVELVRQTVGKEIPIFTLDSTLEGSEIVDQGDNSFVAHPTSEIFLNHVRALTAAKRRQLLLRESTGQREALLSAHRREFPDMDVDDNTRLVLAYLRWEALPAEIVAQEFDTKLLTQKVFEPEKDDIYAKDSETIHHMNEEQREKLRREFDSIEFGYDRTTRCGAFAIDVETLAFEITYGHGNHHKAVVRLEKRLPEINKIIGRGEVKTEEEYEEKILTGRIVEIDSFSVPILKLLINPQQPLITQELIRKVGTHLIKEKRFIPVSENMHVVNGNYQI